MTKQVMTLSQAKRELAAFTTSVEEHINQKYFFNASWSRPINFEVVTIHIVRELWPELDFAYDCEACSYLDKDVVSLEDIRREENRYTDKHEEDEYYDKYERDDHIKQNEMIAAELPPEISEKLARARDLKIRNYEKRYETIEENLNKYFPNMLNEFKTLIEYGVNITKAKYEVSVLGRKYSRK